MFGKVDTDIGYRNAISESRYIGKVCPKHPELKGERRKIGYICVGCNADKRHRQRQKPEARAKADVARRLEAENKAASKAWEESRMNAVKAEAQAMSIANGETNYKKYWVAAMDKLILAGKLK